MVMAVRRIVERVLVGLIDAYRHWISPLKGPTCRFYPSCSKYARDAIVIHGPVRGVLLAAWRVLRCNPLSRGGYDPVPGRRDDRGPSWQERGL